MQLATKTLAAINAALEADQGAAYRQNLGRVIPHMDDAYRGGDEGFRNHMGASLIGGKCARAIWFGFRWVQKAKFPARIIRLFNRGHLEEARFIALLLTIGVNVIQQDANGKQYKVSYFGGLFGGSGDGIGFGIPDFPPGTYALLEFKTYSKKTFDKLKVQGVKAYKPEHYSQMQVYLRGMGLGVALYGAVCKDDDELHFEIIHLDPVQGEQMVQRAYNIITIHKAPERIGKSPSWYECAYCNYKDVCFDEMPTVERNCRTCHHTRVNTEAGDWVCGQTGEVLTKEKQLAACGEYLKFTIDV